MNEEIDFNPTTNPNVMTLVRQKDGNWKGYMQKFGTLVEVRDIDPQTVVVRLITHE